MLLFLKPVLTFSGPRQLLLEKSWHCSVEVTWAHFSYVLDSFSLFVSEFKLPSETNKQPPKLYSSTPSEKKVNQEAVDNVPVSAVLRQVFIYHFQRHVLPTTMFFMQNRTKWKSVEWGQLSLCWQLSNFVIKDLLVLRMALGKITKQV